MVDLGLEPKKFGSRVLNPRPLLLFQTKRSVVLSFIMPVRVVTFSKKKWTVAHGDILTLKNALLFMWNANWVSWLSGGWGRGA